MSVRNNRSIKGNKVTTANGSVNIETGTTNTSTLTGTPLVTLGTPTKTNRTLSFVGPVILGETISDTTATGIVLPSGIVSPVSPSPVSVDTHTDVDPTPSPVETIDYPNTVDTSEIKTVKTTTKDKGTIRVAVLNWVQSHLSPDKFMYVDGLDLWYNHLPQMFEGMDVDPSWVSWYNLYRDGLGPDGWDRYYFCRDLRKTQKTLKTVKSTKVG